MADRIIKPDSGNQIVVQDEGGSAALTVNASGIATFANTIIEPDANYVQGKLYAATDINSSGEMLNLTGTSAPYVTWTGQTSSFSIGSTTTHDFKFSTKGVYFVSFNLSAHAVTSNRHEQVNVQIRGTTSESTSVLSSAITGILNNDDSRTDYGHASAQLIKQFNANDMINFFVDSDQFAGLKAGPETHITIFLLNAVA